MSNAKMQSLKYPFLKGVAWSDPILSPVKQISFFCYSAKLGRRILQSKIQAPLYSY